MHNSVGYLKNKIRQDTINQVKSIKLLITYILLNYNYTHQNSQKYTPRNRPQNIPERSFSVKYLINRTIGFTIVKYK